MGYFIRCCRQLGSRVLDALKDLVKLEMGYIIKPSESILSEAYDKVGIAREAVTTELDWLRISLTGTKKNVVTGPTAIGPLNPIKTFKSCQ